MADWPLIEASRVALLPALQTVPTTGTSMTCGSPHNKGSFAAIGNAPFDAVGITMSFLAKSAATDYLVDLAFGASGSERVIIDNIYVSGATSGSGGKAFTFPLRIPRNTRISLRAQDATLSATIQVAAALHAESFEGQPSYNRFVTYGAVTSTSSGTALGAPGAGAWGAWTTIIAATQSDHTWLMAVLGDQDIGTRTASQKFAYQAGEGSAGNEVIIGPGQQFTTTSTTMGLNQFHGFWNKTARGARLSMRYGSSAATTLGADGMLYAGV